MNIIKSIIMGALLLVATLFVAPAANAADCGVTQNEWQQVDDTGVETQNYTKGIVHAIFGFNGQQTAQYSGVETREYKTCGGWNDGAKVYVTYDYHADGAYGAGWYVQNKFKGVAPA